MTSSVGPVRPAERLLVIDVLRGFALFGILVVNMDVFSSPIYQPRLGWAESAALADRMTGALIRLLAEGKFYPLFSFLFGFGLAVQMARAEARGVRFVPLYARRLLVLLAIGLAHAVLLWHGDILVIYALLGFPLLLFRRRRLRTLMVWAAAALVLPILLEGLLEGVVAGFIRLPGAADPVLEQLIETVPQATEARIQQALQVYGHGSYRQMLAQRLEDLKFVYAVGIFSSPTVFAMFLLGLSTGRRGIFQDLPAYRPVLQKVLVWGLAVGGTGNLIYVIGGDLAGREPSLLAFLSSAAHTLGAPALMLAYASGLSLLLQSDVWQRRLAPLAPVGRMALSNYLLQTVICTTLFYGYGFGLFGRVGLAPGLALTVAICLGQVLLSGWWFRHYAYGPMEWLWRSLTYGRRPP